MNIYCGYCHQNFDSLVVFESHRTGCEGEKSMDLADMLRLRQELDPDAPDVIVFSSCPAQGCTREKGHTGNHWCSVCNERDLNDAEFSGHECYPRDESPITCKAAAQAAQDLYATGWLRAAPEKAAERILASIARHLGRSSDSPLSGNYQAALTEIRARRQKVSDEALSRLGDPHQEKPKWRDIDLLLEIIDLLT